MYNNKMIVVRRIILTLILLTKLDDIGGGKFHHDTLNFSHKNLEKIPADLLEGINNTTSITGSSYSHNSISALKHSDFASFCNFPNLRYLFFDHNVIEEVEASSFDCLPELVYLDLSNNKLSTLSSEVCDKLSKLRRLLYVNIKDNPIENFDFVTELVNKGIEVDYDQPLDENLLELHVIKNRKKRVLPSDLDPLVAQNSTEEEEIDMDISYENLTDFESRRNVTTLSDKYISSIVFNFFAASLVLVVIPLSMFIYYCVSKCERGS